MRERCVVSLSGAASVVEMRPRTALFWRLSQVASWLLGSRSFEAEAFSRPVAERSILIPHTRVRLVLHAHAGCSRPIAPPLAILNISWWSKTTQETFLDCSNPSLRIFLFVLTRGAPQHSISKVDFFLFPLRFHLPAHPPASPACLPPLKLLVYLSAFRPDNPTTLSRLTPVPSQSVWVAGTVAAGAGVDDVTTIDPHCHSEGDTDLHGHPADAELWLCEYLI